MRGWHNFCQEQNLLGFGLWIRYMQVNSMQNWHLHEFVSTSTWIFPSLWTHALISTCVNSVRFDNTNSHKINSMLWSHASSSHCKLINSDYEFTRHCLPQPMISHMFSNFLFFYFTKRVVSTHTSMKNICVSAHRVWVLTTIYNCVNSPN